MSPLLIPILALTIPIVAILAGTWTKVQQMRVETAASLGQATGHLEDELAEAQDERDRLRRRIEALEAIVTSEGYDLEREARRAGIAEEPLLDPGLLDLDAPADADREARRRRTR